jgi:uncharacterized small protein (DUF1192 family)
MDIDESPKPKHLHVVGEVLDAISIAELQSRIAALTDEIRRIEAEIARKQTSRAAADAFFKS